MKTLRLLWAVLLPASLLLSCDHRLDDPNPLGAFRLKSVSYNIRNLDGITYPEATCSLTYDANGLFTGYKLLQKGVSYITNYIVVRDVAGRATAFHRSDNDQVPTFNTAPYGIYTYDTIGKLTSIELRLDYGSRTGSFSRTFMRADYSYDSISTVPTERVIGNSRESYGSTDGNATTVNNVNYAYDNAPNPYRGLVGLNLQPYYNFQYRPSGPEPLKYSSIDNSVYISDLQVKLFNKNNITTNTKQLTYNADGLVTRIEYTDGNVEEFTYERKP